MARTKKRTSKSSGRSRTRRAHLAKAAQARVGPYVVVPPTKSQVAAFGTKKYYLRRMQALSMDQDAWDKLIMEEKLTLADLEFIQRCLGEEEDIFSAERIFLTSHKDVLKMLYIVTMWLLGYHEVEEEETEGDDDDEVEDVSVVRIETYLTDIETTLRNARDDPDNKHHYLNNAEQSFTLVDSTLFSIRDIITERQHDNIMDRYKMLREEHVSLEFDDDTDVDADTNADYMINGITTSFIDAKETRNLDVRQSKLEEASIYLQSLDSLLNVDKTLHPRYREQFDTLQKEYDSFFDDQEAPGEHPVM